MSASPESGSPDARLRCVLTPENAATPDNFYDCLAAELKLPSHFGRNLDALYDCLSGDDVGPFEITVQQPGRMRAMLGDMWDEIAVLLLDVVTERDDATVIFSNG